MFYLPGVFAREFASEEILQGKVVCKLHKRWVRNLIPPRLHRLRGGWTREARPGGVPVKGELGWLNQRPSHEEDPTPALPEDGEGEEASSTTGVFAGHIRGLFVIPLQNLV